MLPQPKRARRDDLSQEQEDLRTLLKPTFECLRENAGVILSDDGEIDFPASVQRIAEYADFQSARLIRYSYIALASL